MEPLYETAITNARNFHYFVIIAISAHSMDIKTWQAYRRFMHNKYDAWSVLEDLKSLESFGMLFDGTIEIFRGDSLQVSKSLTLLSGAVLSCLKWNGGIPTGFMLRALNQIDHKKQRIIGNCVLEYTGDLKDFQGVGHDTHVKRALALVIQVCLREIKGEMAERELLKYVYILTEILPAEIGIYTNEILGTFGQFIDCGSSDKQTQLRDGVFGAMKAQNKIYQEVVERWERKELNNL